MEMNICQRQSINIKIQLNVFVVGKSIFDFDFDLNYSVLYIVNATQWNNQCKQWSMNSLLLFHFQFCSLFVYIVWTCFQDRLWVHSFTEFISGLTLHQFAVFTRSVSRSLYNVDFRIDFFASEFDCLNDPYETFHSTYYFKPRTKRIPRQSKTDSTRNTHIKL